MKTMPQPLVLQGLRPMIHVANTMIIIHTADWHLDGQGVPQDYAEAEKWYRKAAEQGDADAHRNLGLTYMKLGRVEEAEAAYREAHDAFSRLGRRNDAGDAWREAEEARQIRVRIAVAEAGGHGMSGGDWCDVLRVRPDFAGKCDWWKLDGKDWRKLFGERPEFADRCDWSKLDGSDWHWLLQAQQRFADRCDWSKLSGDDWGELLQKRPEFMDKCDWSKLTGDNWCWLLKDQPQFADKVRPCQLLRCPVARLIGWILIGCHPAPLSSLPESAAGQ